MNVGVGQQKLTLLILSCYESFMMHCCKQTDRPDTFVNTKVSNANNQNDNLDLIIIIMYVRNWLFYDKSNQMKKKITVSKNAII